jgi:Ca2+-binding EF-hand superfamily protein
MEVDFKNTERLMTFLKHLPAAVTVALLAFTVQAQADILSPENVSDTYWLPKHREPNDRDAWIKMHVKRFDRLAGKDGILDERDLARQRQASDERTELRSRLSFLELDDDIDGTVSFEEMDASDFSDGARDEDMNVRFARIDDNKDGIVSEREWIAEGFRQQAERDKVNHDYTAYEFARYWGVSPTQAKVLTSNEYQTALGQLYDHYDQNRDGQLSKDEMGAWQNAALSVELVKLFNDYPELKKSPEALKLMNDMKKLKGI